MAVGEDGWRIKRGPVEAYIEILGRAGCSAAQGVTTTRYRCRCKTKHGLVPLRDCELWGQALRGTPLAPAVATGMRFLGGYLCGLSRTHERIPRALHCRTLQALRACARMTWQQIPFQSSRLRRSCERCSME